MVEKIGERRKVGFEGMNTKPEDYEDFVLWWTCQAAVKKIISSPPFKSYPSYLRDELEERNDKQAKLIANFVSERPPKIGLPMGMEFLYVTDYEGKQRKTADFIVNQKLVAVAVRKEDQSKIKTPPGFVTDLSYRLLTPIPKS